MLGTLRALGALGFLLPLRTLDFLLPLRALDLRLAVGDLGTLLAVASIGAVFAPVLATLGAVQGEEFIVDLKRRREQLVARVAELQWDLGGLTYEMAIRNTIRVEVLVKRAADGSCEDVRVALTHMGSTPLRATAVEQALRGNALDAQSIAAAAEQAAEGTDPPADLNASEDYKRHLAGVLTKRALRRAAARACSMRRLTPSSVSRASARSSAGSAAGSCERNTASAAV